MIRKILFLHGYRQNGFIFKELVNQIYGNILKRFHIEPIFCSAPHSLLPFNFEKNKLIADDERGWWLSDLDTTYNQFNIDESESGLDITLHYLNGIFKRNHPIEGIYGFSQGASLSSILCHYRDHNLNNDEKKFPHISFKYAVFLSGFKSEKKSHHKYYSNAIKFKVPTLHLFGKQDDLIKSEMSLDLAKNYFLNPSVYEHDQGHCLPCDQNSREIIDKFLLNVS